MAKFQATSEKLIKVGLGNWHITVIANTPDKLAERIQEFEAWWVTWEEQSKQAAKAARKAKKRRAENDSN